MEYSEFIVREDGTPKSVKHTGSDFRVNFQPAVAGVSFKSSYDKKAEAVTVMHVAFLPEVETQIDTLLSKEGTCTIVEKDEKTGVFRNPTVKRSALVPKVRQVIDGYVVKMYGLANEFSQPVLS